MSIISQEAKVNSQEAKVNSQEEKLKKMISILKSASTESSDEGKMIKNLKDIKLNNTDADFEILQTTYSDNNILIYALDNGYVTLTEKIVELCNTNFPSRLIEFLNTKNSKGETGYFYFVDIIITTITTTTTTTSTTMLISYLLLLLLLTLLLQASFRSLSW